MNTNTNKAASTDKLSQFTKPDILHTIGFVRVAKLLGVFSSDFARANIVVPAEPDYNHPPVNGEYYDAVAAVLASSSLPQPLLRTLVTIEHAARPEHEAALDRSLQRRIPCVGVNRACPLDCALELFFACPDELAQFIPDSGPVEVNSPRVAAGGVKDEDDLQIENQKSKIENAEPAAIPPGAQLLHEVCARFEYYLVLPPGAAVALTLWTAHAHCFTAFRLTPRLNLQSPEAGCGKTTTLDVIASLVPRPVRTENLTAPILFRLVDQSQPTLLLDEVDAYLPQAEELRGLLNAGHKRGACAYRCSEGKSNTVRSFKAFAPAVLSGLGKLPGTLHDRSIHIPLIKAEPGQIKAWFDESHADLEATLNQKLACWTRENFEAFQNCRPIMPATAHNRLGDNWRPLFAIAEIAGGDWPQLAVDAFTTLSARAGVDAKALGIQLLKDIRQVFETAAVDRMSSRQLVAELRELEDGRWEMAHENGPINEGWLARRLREFGIEPRNVRIGERQCKGYYAKDVGEAMEDSL